MKWFLKCSHANACKLKMLHTVLHEQILFIFLQPHFLWYFTGIYNFFVTFITLTLHSYNLVIVLQSKISLKFLKLLTKYFNKYVLRIYIISQYQILNITNLCTTCHSQITSTPRWYRGKNTNMNNRFPHLICILMNQISFTRFISNHS